MRTGAILNLAVSGAPATAWTTLTTFLRQRVLMLMAALAVDELIQVLLGRLDPGRLQRHRCSYVPRAIALYACFFVPTVGFVRRTCSAAMSPQHSRDIVLNLGRPTSPPASCRTTSPAGQAGCLSR